jgi:hypothetical protein
LILHQLTRFSWPVFPRVFGSQLLLQTSLHQRRIWNWVSASRLSRIEDLSFETHRDIMTSDRFQAQINWNLQDPTLQTIDLIEFSPEIGNPSETLTLTADFLSLLVARTL